MMNPDELLKQYQTLRSVQKAFFKKRDRDDLELAKTMERNLDKAVAEYFEQKARDKDGQQQELGL